MSAHTHSASCTCGQVVFDLSKKKAGHILICPWCRKKYKLIDHDRIEEWKGEGEIPPPPPESKPPKEDVVSGESKPRKHTTLIVKKRNVTSVSSKVVAVAKPEASATQAVAKASNEGLKVSETPKNGNKAEAEGSTKSDLVLKRSQSSVFTKSKLALLRKAAEAAPDGQEGGPEAPDAKDESAKESGATEAVEMPDNADISESGMLETGETGVIEEVPGEPKKKKKKKKKKKRSKRADDEREERGGTEKIDLDELGNELSSEIDDPGKAQSEIPALTGESLYSLDGDSVDAHSSETRPTERLQAISTRSIPMGASRRSRPSAGLDVDFIDEPQPPPPLTLEKLVVYMFIAAVPIGALSFAFYMWWGIQEGIYNFQDREIFGIVIKGNNPWVWVGGILLGALTFLLGWVAYMYLFVYRKKDEKDEKGEKRAPGPKRARKAADKE